MRIFRQKIIRNPWLLAFLGFLVLAVITFALNLPSHISVGEKGQAAIQMLDAMRRPFLEIKTAETLLIGTDDRKLAISDFNKAIESGNRLLARYRQLAEYNPELSGRVAKLSDAYANWISVERRLFDYFLEDSMGENDRVVKAQILRDLNIASALFLNTMNRLGEGEIPIHEDISEGRMATHIMLASLGLLFLYLIGLIYLQQRAKTQELESKVEMTTVDLKEANRSLAQEIIERKDAQEEVEKSLSLLRATLESTADGILVVNDEGKIVGLNQRFVVMWRIPESIVASKNDNQALVYVLDQLKDPEGFLAKMRELYSQPAAESFDLLEFKDGRVFERYSRPQRIGARVVGRVWSFRDVTERKRAEEAIRESEERFRSVSQSANDAIISADSSGRVISWNKGAQIIFGYSEEEVLGKPLIMLMPERYRDAHQKGFERLYSTGEYRIIGKTVELHGLRKDGAEFPLELSISTWSSGRKRFCSAIIRDITWRKEAEEKIKHMAYHDPLTDLPNRALFFDRLHQAILVGQRENGPVALFILDLDDFKEINDSVGHHYGDLMLQAVGERLRGIVRKSDTVSRLGGDEFALLLPGTNMEGATLTAHKILETIKMPFSLEEKVFNIGVSIGIALFPDHSEDSGLLIKKADIAMYQAKESGAGYALYVPAEGQV